jgi:hypothetical protein
MSAARARQMGSGHFRATPSKTQGNPGPKRFRVIRGGLATIKGVA